MKLRAGRVLVAMSLMGVLAGACGAGSEGSSTTVSEALASSDGAVSATVAINDWGGGYNGTVTVTNNGSTPTSTWSVVVNSRGSTISQVWSANSQTSGSTVTFTPLSWNAAIPAHGSITFGFGASPGGAANEAQLVSVTQSGATGGGTTGTAGGGGGGGTAGSTSHAGTGGGGMTGSGATGSGATGSGATGSGATGSGATGNSSCTPQTFEAESITHSVGGAQDSGWDIWSNGNISTNVAFAGGSTTITVIAKGTSAGGVWPNMVVRVNGVQVGSVAVNSAAYASYPFTFNASAGTQSVSVEFTNDAVVGSEDRNLIVDKFTVSCISGSTGGGNTGTGGSTGTGGNTGTGGSAGTGGSTGGGTTSCSLPPAIGSGSQSLTWYYFGQGTARNGSQYQTACGYLGSESGTDDTVNNIATPNDYFVAIPGATSSNFTNSNYCGACVQITNANNGRSVTATVIDECPIDSNPACAAAGHLDVSKTAFDALGFSVGNPSSGVSWKVVPCNVSGNVKVRVKSGNSNQVYIENERLPIKTVTQNGGQATRLSYGAWQLPGNAAGSTLVLTDASGRQISVAVTGSTSDQDTGSQFPSCQ